MKRTYCTYFDRNYLFKALALVESINKHEKQEFELFAVCLDEISRIIINKLNLPHVIAIPINILEERDEPLLGAKKNRSLVEYYFTLTPTIILRLLERFDLQEITYLDADLYFFSSTDPIFAEFEGYSVMIHEHRFSPRQNHLKIYGKYNVGLLCFRNDENGLRVLTWWRDRCIEWCYARLEDGKYADQLYLEDWTERFSGVRVLENIGAGVAPWNHDQYSFHHDEHGQMLVDNLPLIFYHYHALLIINPDVMVPDKFSVYPMNEEILQLLFLPYIRALSNSVKTVKAILPDFDFGLNPQTPINNSTTFMAKKDFLSQLPDTTVFPQTEIDLNSDWRGYLAIPTMVISIIMPPSPPKICIITPSLNKGPFIEECIDSILSQNYPNLQYIIMDGGSTDDTIRIIKKYEKHLTYWQSQTDRGQYDAINEGFKHASGEIMTWLNADDRFHPDAFVIAAHIFSDYPDIQWITGRPNGFDKSGANPWVVNPLPSWSRENLLKRKYLDLLIQQEGTFWHRSLWEKAGAYVDYALNLAGDFELWVRFFRHAQLFTIDTLLAGIRTYDDQKSKRYRSEYIAEMKKVLNEEIALWQKGIETSMMPAAPVISIHRERSNGNKTLIEIGEELYQAGDLEKAITIFLEAVEQKQEAHAAHNNLGVLYWQKGYPSTAIKYLSESVKTNPSYRPAIINYAEILKAFNRTEDALHIYQNYLRDHPDDHGIQELAVALSATIE